MANCGDDEAFRDSDRALAMLAKSRLIGNVPCRLPDAMRMGGWLGRSVRPS
jgi:hypothetical protein